MAKKEKSALRQLIDEREIRDLAGVQELVKELTSGLIQEIMDAMASGYFYTGAASGIHKNANEIVSMILYRNKCLSMLNLQVIFPRLNSTSILIPD